MCVCVFNSERVKALWHHYVGFAAIMIITLNLDAFFSTLIFIYFTMHTSLKVALKMHALYIYIFFLNLQLHNFSCLKRSQKQKHAFRNYNYTKEYFMDTLLIKFCVNYEPILNILARLKWGSAFGTCARTHCAVMPMWDTQAQINHRADLAVAYGDLKSKGP